MRRTLPAMVPVSAAPGSHFASPRMALDWSLTVQFQMMEWRAISSRRAGSMVTPRLVASVSIRWRASASCAAASAGSLCSSNWNFTSASSWSRHQSVAWIAANSLAWVHSSSAACRMIGPSSTWFSQ